MMVLKYKDIKVLIYIYFFINTLLFNMFPKVIN